MAAALQLRHFRGFNGELYGSVVAHPTEPSTFVYIVGSLLVIGDESNAAAHRLLRGHDAPITALAVSHNGKLIATGSSGENADVVLWDAETGAIRFRFQEHDRRVSALAFSPDDRVLASAGADSRLFCIDTGSGKIIGHSHLPSDAVTTLTASPLHGPCYYFATGSDADLGLWTLDPFKGWLHEDKVALGAVKRHYTTLTFAADGAWLYAGTKSGDVVTVNVTRKAIQLVHPLCSIAVGAIVVSSTDPRQLLIGGGDGSLGYFNNETMRTSAPMPGAVPGHITSLSYMADGVSLIIGTIGGGIFKISADMGIETVAQSQMAPMRGVCFAPGSSDAVASCSGHANGSVCLWDLSNTPVITTYISESRKLSGVQVVAMSNEAVLSGWGDGFIRCHDLGGRFAWEIPDAHNSARARGCNALHMAHRSPFFVSAGTGGEIRVWDMNTRNLFSSMVLHVAAVNDVLVLQDDVHLVAAGDDKIWTLWDLYGQRNMGSFGHQSQICVKALATTPDQRALVTVGLGNRINVWDIGRSNKPVRSVETAHQATMTVAVSNGGGLFATGGADAVVRLWDWNSLKCVGEFVGHSACVNKVAFSADDATLVSVAEDGTMAVWDVEGAR